MGKLGGNKPPLASNNLVVVAGPVVAHVDRLKNADGSDALGEFEDGRIGSAFVEAPYLLIVGTDAVYGEQEGGTVGAHAGSRSVLQRGLRWSWAIGAPDGVLKACAQQVVSCVAHGG